MKSHEDERLEHCLKKTVMDFMRGRGKQGKQKDGQRLVVMPRMFTRPPPEVEQRALAGTGIFSLKYEIDNSNGDLLLVGLRSLWSAAVEAELNRYSRLKRIQPEINQNYNPKSMCAEQLRLGALEALRRCQEEMEDTNELTYVLVARKCKKVPSPDMEVHALQGTTITKLWYALTEEGDLLITKFACGPEHGDAVALVVTSCGNFANQFGRGDPIFRAGTDGTRVLISGTKVAADGVIQRSFPRQVNPQQLRASLVIELEYEHRGPKALMERLSEYLLQPVADFVLGIKVYKRSGPPPAAGATRPFAAIALLWRRGFNNPPGTQAAFIQAWSFGTCQLPSQSVNAFRTQHGTLQQVPAGAFIHPSPHTAATDTVRILLADLLVGVVDQNGNPVPAPVPGQDFVHDLGYLRDYFGENLPP